MLRIPIAIHEQNSVPGLANRLAGKLADRVFISLPCVPPFPIGKTVRTGNPVRREILAAARQMKQEGEKQTVLILGGSQGAHRVNTLMMEAAAVLAQQKVPLQLVHQTGAADQEMVDRCYKNLGMEAEVTAFIGDMAAAYSRAGLVVSRAGATTLAELAVMGLPALLIPYPHAADNHQVTNGEYYEKRGGCLMVAESALSGEKLARLISEHLQNMEELHTMSATMKSLAMPDATDRIVDECLRLAARTEQHL
jgi:UDP-N-acetylglucosamine--N-acetylmuramyl-(pentapeptide) pyrophosphoryl-undecaprenol N-acetylglucosamine transferase